MDIAKLQKFAEENANKDNASFLALGISDSKLTKVRAYLRATIDRCKIITANTQKNNRYMDEIQDYVTQLTNFGLIKPDQPTPPTPPPTPPPTAPTIEQRPRENDSKDNSGNHQRLPKTP